MMKLSYIVIVTLAAFALVFAGCDSAGAGGDGDGNDGGGGGDDNVVVIDEDELTLTATVTHTFAFSPSPRWEADFDHDDFSDRYYGLLNATEDVDPPEIIDRDPDSGPATSNSFSLSTGVPDEGDMLTAADWGFSSDPAGVNLYAAIVGMGDDDGGNLIAEGNFDINLNDHAEYYEYIYAAEDCTLSGTAKDGDDEYTMNDVELSAGWNAIITRVTPTEQDVDFDYYSGETIAGAEWTLMME